MRIELLENRGGYSFPHPTWVISGNREELLHLFNSLDNAIHTFAEESIQGPNIIKIEIIE